jgi:hypothetical protein
MALLELEIFCLFRSSVLSDFTTFFPRRKLELSSLLWLWSDTNPYQPDITVASSVGVCETSNDVSSVRGLLD